MRNAIYILCTLVGAILIGGILRTWIVKLPGVEGVCFVFGGLAGLSLARGFYAPTPIPKPRVVQQPVLSAGERNVPYFDRLKQFLGGERDSTPDDFASAMPFWSRYDFFTRTAPKSTAWMRRILRRIRALVRGQ